MNAGPFPARTSSSAVPAASRTVQRSLPSMNCAGSSIASTRLLAVPAVTSSDRVYSPYMLFSQTYSAGSEKTFAKLRHS